MDLMGISLVDWLGYAATATVLISFLMPSEQKLRLVNAFGCLLFVAYGVVLTPVSKPIIITNVAILLINGYYLVKKRKINF
ncbi:uroporphyrinogen decarboxylase [Gaetbulibacter aestuarii]|uniref:Uroporphyrinogen decarboxylase n=1 Tax=Gaetbulibacter aestuarii TaxID=1502358 RepID=A0ABW7MYG7_9FLAO